jgi:peptide/nickel transport system permease protein
LAFLEPLISLYVLGGSSLKIGRFATLLLPSNVHIFGTDWLGRDLLLLQFVGLKYSLLIGIIAGGIATIMAVVIAITAGYLGGKIDALLSSIINALLVIPSFPILVAVSIYMRVDLVIMSLLLAVFSWAGTSRQIRSQILTLKERTYINLALVSGEGRIRIMFLEIMPNLFPFILMGFARSVIGAIGAETGIRLLGVGPGDIQSLGLMLTWALNWGAISLGYPYMVIAPALFLVLIFISFTFISVGVEIEFNPRLKRITGL